MRAVPYLALLALVCRRFCRIWRPFAPAIPRTSGRFSAGKRRIGTIWHYLARFHAQFFIAPSYFCLSSLILPAHFPPSTSVPNGYYTLMLTNVNCSYYFIGCFRLNHLSRKALRSRQSFAPPAAGSARKSPTVAITPCAAWGCEFRGRDREKRQGIRPPLKKPSPLRPEEVRVSAVQSSRPAPRRSASLPVGSR